MSRETPEGRILTKFEVMLDSQHRTLPLWAEPRPVAMFATLAAFDLMMLPIAVGVTGAGSNPRGVQKVKEYHDSLIHAMRFFWEESHDLIVHPTAEEKMLRKACDFLSHCAKYGTLADFHAGYGGGLYRLEADEEKQWIRFVHTPSDGSTPEPAGILEDTPADWQQFASAMENPLIAQQTVEIIEQVSHTGREDLW